jgi:hypothetical protein
LLPLPRREPIDADHRNELSDRRFRGSSPEPGDKPVDKDVDGDPRGNYSAALGVIAYFLCN